MKEGVIKLADLLNQYGSEQIPYAKLLEANEWKTKRQVIIDRDGACCTNCKKEATTYINNMHVWMDWEDVHPATSFLSGTEYKIVAETADKPYHLEVHHKFYIHNHYPWQYADEALVTLCNWCHQKLHQQTVVPYYSDEGKALGYIPCGRCNGVGQLPEFSHVQSGVCFQCGGARYQELIGVE